MTVTVTVAGAVGVPDDGVVLVVCAWTSPRVPITRTIIVVYPHRPGNIDGIGVTVVTHAFAQERVGRLL